MQRIKAFHQHCLYIVDEGLFKRDLLRDSKNTKIFLADRRDVLRGARNEDKPSWLQVNFGVLFSNPACDKALDTLILL